MLAARLSRFSLRATLTVVVAATIALSAVQPAAAAQAADPSLASVSGTVTGESGQPLANELVYLMENFGTSYQFTAYAYTDAQGTYLVEDVDPGTYSIHFYGVAGHVEEWWNDKATSTVATTFTVAAGAHLVGFDAQLSTGATISGVVSDTSGATVANATVTLYGLTSVSYSWRAFESIATDSSGAYSFGSLNPGPYAVKVTPPSGSALVENWWPDTPYEAGATRFAVSRDEAVTGINVQLPRGSEIHGTVTDAAGNPISGAPVHANGEGDPSYAYDSFTLNATTDAHGDYSFYGLKAGGYHMSFYAPNGANYLGSRSAAFSVGADESVAGKNGTLAAGGAISGVVTGRNGLPLANVGVSYLGDQYGVVESTRTNEFGAYSFQRIAPGRYTVHFAGIHSGNYRSDTDYFNEWWHDSPDSAGRLFFTIETGQQLTDIDANLTPEATISGIVTDSEGVGTSADVRLYAVENGALRYITYAWVGVDGYYRFDDIRAGTYTIRYSVSNHLSEWWGDQTEEIQAQSFVVNTGDILTGMDVQLSVGASITGTVTQPDGSLAKNEPVNVYTVDADGQHIRNYLRTDNDGNYYIGGLSAGDYTVQLGSSSSGTFADEWWEDSVDAEHATIISLAPHQAVTGISAQLSPAPVRLVGTKVTGTAVVGSTLTATASTTPSNATRSYQWLADGVAIDGATGSSLVLNPAQLGSAITVRITATATGYAANTKESTATAAVAAATLVAGTPEVSGILATGSVLEAATGTWTSGTSFAYEWLADGLAIDGATESTLTLAPEQGGKAISVRVTGSKLGYATTSRTSAATSTVYLAGTPVVVGMPTVGSTLTANSGMWAAGSALSYQWLTGASVISGATSATFTVTSAQVDQGLSVRVTGSLSPYPPTTRDSVATLKVPTVGKPTISGSPATNATLTAKPGTWSPGTTFDYQWYANGTEIAGATESTVVVEAAQAGTRMTVRVTGATDGYPSISALSPSTALIYRAPAPTISGTPAIGSTLTAVRGSWTTGSTFTYQWYRDGAAISGATYSTLKMSSSYAGKHISVRVTGHRSGYPTTKRTSAETLSIIKPATPTISGTAAVAHTLTAATGTWTTGTTFTYQWYTNGVAIVDATESTFVPTADHMGTRVTVKVTGTQPGYATAIKTSSATAKVALVSTPVVTGTLTAGSKLTAVRGTWTPTTTFTYRWYLNGVAISGATNSTLTLSSNYVGKEISVRVTGALSGYPTISKTSERTAAVAAAGG